MTELTKTDVMIPWFRPPFVAKVKVRIMATYLMVMIKALLNGTITLDLSN
jgi:hypothetical protein